MLNHYFDELADKGLNLQAIFVIDDLPSEIQHLLGGICKNLKHYSQLVLLGHGGKKLWNEVKIWRVDQNSSKFSNITQPQTEDPIDDYSIAQTKEYFHKNYSIGDFEIIFPLKNLHDQINQPTKPIDLQALGKLAGWHNESPFKVGINKQWGSWFAYRAVVLIKSDITTQQNKSAISPCVSCTDKPCLSACPAHVVGRIQISIDDCITCRVKQNSNCNNKCLARLACPVKQEHQYNLEQLTYHYSLSLKMIEELRNFWQLRV